MIRYTHAPMHSYVVAALCVGLKGAAEHAAIVADCAASSYECILRDVLSQRGFWHNKYSVWFEMGKRVELPRAKKRQIREKARVTTCTTCPRCRASL